MQRPGPDTRRMIKGFYRPWWRRSLSVLFVLVVPLIVGRIVLTPLLQGTVRKHLERTQGPGVVTFGDLDVFLFPPSVAFKDVVIRTGSATAPGDSLVVERLEVHVVSVQALSGPVPHLRARMVRPRLQVRPGGRDLERVARALPTARVDVTSVEGGQIGIVGMVGGGDGRPLLEGMNGDIEGISTGAEVGRGGWQVWSDGRLLERNPIHAFVKLEPDRAWQATLTLQEIPTGRAPSGDLPISVDARLRGSGARLQAKIHAAWAGETAPHAVAENMVRSLPETGSGGLTPTLSMIDLKAGPASVGQSIDLVAEADASGTAGAPAFHAFDLPGVLVAVFRLANRAVLPAPLGMATLLETAQQQASEPPADAQ